jgi:hypothetical protein
MLPAGCSKHKASTKQTQLSAVVHAGWCWHLQVHTLSRSSMCRGPGIAHNVWMFEAQHQGDLQAAEQQQHILGCLIGEHCWLHNAASDCPLT